MPVTASPNTLTLYASSASNAGNPTATVALTQTPANTGGYTVSNPSPGQCTASISGATLTVSYVAPLATAGTPVVLTITGDSGQTTTVSVYTYGVLTLVNTSPSGAAIGSIVASEPGYAGTLTFTLDPPIASFGMDNGPGPTFGPVLTTPVSPGDSVVTVTDDHGGSAQILLTVYEGSVQQSRPLPIGYPTAGAWFDFLHPDAEGLPTVGEIRGMNVTGAAPLRGPNDLANFAWCSGSGDLIAQFGIGYGDMGQAIQTMFTSKSDFFFEELADAAPTSVKAVDWVQISTSVPAAAITQQLTFNTVITTDFYSAVQSSGATSILASGAVSSSLVGTAIVGIAVVGGATATSSFQVTQASIGKGGDGRVLQASFSETSVFGWTILGFTMRLSAQEGILP